MGKLRRGDWDRREKDVQAKLDHAAAQAWTHPADGPQAQPEKPVDQAADMLRTIIVDTLPDPKHCGGARRLRVGYVRYCAWLFRVCPEMYPGMDHHAMAALVGVHVRKWHAHLAEVDASLRRRRSASR